VNSWNYAVFLTQQVMVRKYRKLVTRYVLNTLHLPFLQRWLVFMWSMSYYLAINWQEVEEQDSACVPAAPSPDNEEGGRDSSRLNASGRNKWRRTSEVWQYFDEVRENGETWAKCKSCSNRYRGESKRGTTNLRRHLEKYCAGRK